METVRRKTEGLQLNEAFVKPLLTGFIRDAIHNIGWNKGIVGLSGGLDSAVAAALAAEALGKDNLLGVILPYKTSSPKSREDAEAFAREVGIRTETIDISPMADSYLKAAGIKDKLRVGNILARQRMIVLFDLSARDRALVIGTSNKTELFLGYGTLYGDMACGLNPLGDLYKTQVRQLASALGVPQQIISKTPTADLWDGQTDEGELGFTYDEVDRLLFCLIDERRSVDEAVALGFDRGFVDRVRERIRRTQFKRRLPIIAKVSNRTLNLDFRYARDWGI